MSRAGWDADVELVWMVSFVTDKAEREGLKFMNIRSSVSRGEEFGDAFAPRYAKANPNAAMNSIATSLPANELPHIGSVI